MYDAHSRVRTLGRHQCDLTGAQLPRLSLTQGPFSAPHSAPDPPQLGLPSLRAQGSAAPTLQPQGAKPEAVTAPPPARASSAGETREGTGHRPAHLPRGQHTRHTVHGRTGTDPAAGQPPRPAERKGKEARPVPWALQEAAPGRPRLTCSPGRARSPRQLPPPLPPVCRGPAARCPLAAALALPLAAAAPLPPRPARPLVSRGAGGGPLRADARVPLAGGGAGGGTRRFQWLGELSVRRSAVIGGGGGAMAERALREPRVPGGGGGRRFALRLGCVSRPPLPAAGATARDVRRQPGERLQLKGTAAPHWGGARWSWGPKIPPGCR